MKTRPTLVIALLAFSSGVITAASPLGTAFTYQGRLSAGTNPATGTYDFSFALWDASAGGLQQGSALTNSAVGVTNGNFTVNLDFGAVFNGDARWLELGVRTNGGGAFTTLSPRLPLTPTPYAIYSPTAGTVADGAITSSKLAPGAIGPAQLASSAVTSASSSSAPPEAWASARATHKAPCTWPAPSRPTASTPRPLP